jgi:phosphoribosyl 1,2-cyclic phosphodiesterase
MPERIGVRVWGARGSLPRLTESQLGHGGNTLCLEILHSGSEWIILDAGTGIANLGDHILATCDRGTIHLFLSHYHWDHIMGLPFFGPVYREGFATSLYGLQGGEGHIDEMLEAVFSPFYSPIYSPKNLTGRLSIPPHENHHRIDDLEVKTIELADIHPGGYMVTQVEGFGKRLVYASDVELREPEVIEAFIRCCQGADLLICDANSSQEQYEVTRGWGHSSLERAYEVAHAAGVKRLMGIHFDPQRTDRDLEEVQTREQGRFEGTTIELAREGETVWL